ncbi:MAG: helix-turn-helix domain-containing protein [Paracoccaceae bacterium]|nr:helix-turn-helix domain-containing protein [Paracoccaceae bacterium]
MPAAPIALPAADQRSAEILDRARLAFAEKGFDGASMQDLARATGMSVGNFYRYFPSKAAIVEAIITGDLAEIEQDFAAILEATCPMDRLRETIRARVRDDHCSGKGQLWAEITAAALRKPEIGIVANRMERVVAGYLITVFARTKGISLDAAARRYDAHAGLIMMMVRASAVQGATPGEARDQLTNLILRTIDQCLDEISSDADEA